MGQNTPDTIPSYKALSPEMDTPVRFVDAQIVYNHSILLSGTTIDTRSHNTALTFYLSEDGTMFSCGLGGNDGRLGQPDNSSKTCYVPTAILKWKEDIVCPIKQIAVGRFHCLAITGFLSSTSFLTCPSPFLQSTNRKRSIDRIWL